MHGIFPEYMDIPFHPSRFKSITPVYVGQSTSFNRIRFALLRNNVEHDRLIRKRGGVGAQDGAVFHGFPVEQV